MKNYIISDKSTAYHLIHEIPFFCYVVDLVSRYLAY